MLWCLGIGRCVSSLLLKTVLVSWLVYWSPLLLPLWALTMTVRLLCTAVVPVVILCIRVLSPGVALGFEVKAGILT